MPVSIKYDALNSTRNRNTPVYIILSVCHKLDTIAQFVKVSQYLEQRMHSGKVESQGEELLWLLGTADMIKEIAIMKPILLENMQGLA